MARVVLISSFASPTELPWIARLARATGLHRLVVPQLLPLLPRVAQWLFSVGNGTEYELLRRIIRDTHPDFVRWAIAQIVHWLGGGPAPVARIHGTADRLLPAGAALSRYRFPGGHFIIVSRAAEISEVLNALARGAPD